MLDEFIVKQLSDLSDETSEHFKEILSIKIEDVIAKSESAQEYTMLRRKQEQIENSINNQIQNLREVDVSIKPYIQEDIRKLSAELKELEVSLEKLDSNRENSMIAVRDLEQTKERLLSFAEYSKGAQPEVLVSLIQSVVERIYIVDKDDERFCHIFMKSCSGEDYTAFFRATRYIETATIPENDDMCDLDKNSICAEISQADNLQANKSGYRTDIGNFMQKKRDRDNRSRMLPGSYPYAGKDSP